MENKKWWKSKLIWTGVITAVIAAYNSAASSFGLPSIPDYVYGILGTFGVYARTTSNTVLTK